ncbi:Mitotic checkpoint serine/threonine-protein kinase BUB1 [Liparis tanakae]|uniref:Mitotic checkpoint serine/threonine-protein kinase BUB1 n=1 Tax=Liparis tanakae TaxID=230148 RepID=A0A4Z2H724_9TELE|nr:Mitotic checkpoint serine/threonine-protein kinase BUB1 [Liparis tanakae]
MELSPSGDAFARLLPAPAAHGTIVGEGVAPPPHGLTCFSITLVEAPPPAALSFRDQTPTGVAAWDVYESPEPAPPPGPRREAFTIMQDLERGATSPERGSATSPERGATPMSPERGGAAPMSPEQGDATPMSPERGGAAPMSPERGDATPMSPERGGPTSPEQGGATPMSPERGGATPTSPERGGQALPGAPVSPGRPQPGADVPMSPAPLAAEDEASVSADVSLKASRGARGPLLSDPWDPALLSRLLAALSPPLAAHPRCVSWPCKLPAIRPKTTIRMGRASLRVDCVLGEGAFATVYQATDPETSERTVLKVQKPANPWEFYVNVQLDARLQPDVRRLFGAVSSAHLFQDGSVLLGELHNHGTLLNAVNIYKTMSDKVMPQPLVMYFAVCILHMVEQLHAVQVVHADIKPDNFLLGDRFLDSRSVGPEELAHGLVLVDLGQSIDMRLNPHSELWHDFFHFLLNAPGGAAPLGLRRLRRSLAAALQQNYGAKLPALKSRMMVLLLENRRAAPRR